MTHSDTPGMACLASARVARGWINSRYRLHEGRTLVRNGRGSFLSFWEFLCFIFPTITAGGGCLGTCIDPVFSTNTIPSAPGDERGEKRFKRGCLVGGLAVVGLGPLLFQSDQEQHYPRSGALALRKGVTSGLALSGWGAGAAVAGFTDCWVGVGLGWLGAGVELERFGRMCRMACDNFCEALSKTCYCASKKAVGADRGIKEGDLVCVLDFRQREPQVALEHHQAGHGPTHCLGGGLGGTQWQVCCTSQLPESHRIRLRLSGVWPDRPGGSPSSGALRPPVQLKRRSIQRALKWSCMARMGGRPLPSSRLRLVGKGAQPLTHPAEASFRTPFLQHHQGSMFKVLYYSSHTQSYRV